MALLLDNGCRPSADLPSVRYVVCCILGLDHKTKQSIAVMVNAMLSSPKTPLRTAHEQLDAAESEALAQLPAPNMAFELMGLPFASLSAAARRTHAAAQ